MRTIWMALILFLVSDSLALAQSSSQRPDPPTTKPSPKSVISTSGVTAGPDSSAEIRQLRSDVAAVHKIAEKIAKTQEREGSLLLKVRDGFLTNLLWELFGFKNTEKTLVGHAIALIGILGLVFRAILFLQGKPESKLVTGLTYAYLVVVVTVFSLLAFSGGVASDIPASSSAAKPILEATARLEKSVDSRLKILDDRLARQAVSKPPSPTSSSLDANATETLRAWRGDLKAIHSAAETAAQKASEAAGRSSGWGWHLVIVMFLIAVLIAQIAVLAQSRQSQLGKAL